mgnify:CR=1 FL=1
MTKLAETEFFDLSRYLPKNVADFLQQDYHGNSVQRWLTAVLVSIAVFLLLGITKRLILARLKHLAAKTETTVDDLLIDLVERTKRLFLFVVALWIAHHSLDWTELRGKTLFDVLYRNGKVNKYPLADLTKVNAKYIKDYTNDESKAYGFYVQKGLFEEYAEFGRGHGHDLAPFDVYHEVRGLRWPVVDGKETLWRFREGYDPYVKKGEGLRFYGFPDGKANIFALPYQPAAESPDKEFDLWLCTGRVLEHWHTGTMTMRIPQLARAMPQAYCELHREDARALGVADGDTIVIESRRGAVELPVWIDGRGQPPRGTVFVPFFDESIAINLATLEAHDPLSKQPDYKKCAVRLRRKAAS